MPLTDEQRGAARREYKMRAASAQDERNAMVQALHDLGCLRSCSELVETVTLPADIAAVMSTGRTELLAIITPRALTVEECAQIYKFIGVLVRTNFALQAHARAVQQMCETAESNMRGVYNQTIKLGQFAGFTNSEDTNDD